MKGVPGARRAGWARQAVGFNLAGLLGLVFVFVSCASEGPLEGLELLNGEEPDTAYVHRGRVSGFLQVLKEPKDYGSVLRAIEEGVQRRQEVLRRWALEMTGLSVREFRFTFAGWLKPQGHLVVRYFAGTEQMDAVYAGAQVVFVISPEKQAVLEILFDRVPYE